MKVYFAMDCTNTTRTRGVLAVSAMCEYGRKMIVEVDPSEYRDDQLDERAKNVILPSLITAKSEYDEELRKNIEHSKRTMMFSGNLSFIGSAFATFNYAVRETDENDNFIKDDKIEFVGHISLGDFSLMNIIFNGRNEMVYNGEYWNGFVCPIYTDIYQIIAAKEGISLSAAWTKYKHPIDLLSNDDISKIHIETIKDGDRELYTSRSIVEIIRAVDLKLNGRDIETGKKLEEVENN